MLIIIICIIISIVLGRLIKMGIIDPLIEAYIKNEKYDFKSINKVRNYTGDSLYSLACIFSIYGILSYANYNNSIVMFIIALGIWFIITFIGIQLIDK